MGLFQQRGSGVNYDDDDDDDDAMNYLLFVQYESTGCPDSCFKEMKFIS